jgi:transcriptional regulator with XRE-family HTH domain
MFSDVTPQEFKQKRESLKLSQQELADKLGVTKNIVYNIEKGKQRLKEHIAEKLSRLAPPANASDAVISDELPIEEKAMILFIQGLGWSTIARMIKRDSYNGKLAEADVETYCLVNSDRKIVKDYLFFRNPENYKHRKQEFADIIYLIEMLEPFEPYTVKDLTDHQVVCENPHLANMVKCRIYDSGVKLGVAACMVVNALNSKESSEWKSAKYSLIKNRYANYKGFAFDPELKSDDSIQYQITLTQSEIAALKSIVEKLK